MNFPHKEQNGILRHLYRKDKNFYNNTQIFSYDCSGVYGTRYPFNAFDFGTSSYWLDSENPNSNNENFISFCFKKGFAEIKGFELKTSSGSMRANVWTFSASNDNEKWSFNTTTSHKMNSSEVLYVDWNHGPFKCYRFDFIKNVNEYSRTTDVSQIELFGTYYPHDFFVCATKKQKYYFYHESILLVACLFSY